MDAKTLEDSEIKIATRYAVRQLNKFPGWFEELARSYPQKVTEALLPVIAADLRLRDPEAHPELLDRWRQLPRSLHLPIARAVLHELEQVSPRNVRALEDALSVCRWLVGDDSSRFHDLCAVRIDEAESVEHGALWWCALAAVDPLGAVCHLEDFAEGAAQEDLDDIMEAICARFGQRQQDQELIAPALLNDPEALERFIPIVYDSIRVEDDQEDTSGRAHWIGPRQNAEYFRGRVFEGLSAIGTSAAFAALERLAVHPRMARHRDILLRHARQSPQRSIQAVPMSAEQALDWSWNHAMPVRSANELHQVTLDRLDDIRQQVERGESSTRTLFASADEKDFQPWFMEQFETRNRHSYTVHREEEADRKKMPDIRLAHSACENHPVSIEIKVAENWTGRELRGALFDQLVGRYMRAAKSRHGVLLLCSRGKGKRWDLGGKRLDFQQSLKFLQTEAGRLVAERDDIDALDVVGIDFH